MVSCPRVSMKRLITPRHLFRIHLRGNVKEDEDKHLGAEQDNTTEDNGVKCLLVSWILTVIQRNKVPRLNLCGD